MDKISSRKTLWIVGMMGAGKSTVGPVLAKSLGMDFVDSDREIERREGKSIPQIFAERGEHGFRLAEFKAIKELAGKDLGVALGGGAIAEEEMPKFLSGTGTVIYLVAKPETLIRRIASDSGRPLLSGLDDEERREVLDTLLRQRGSSYETASVRVSTDGLNPLQIARKVEEKLERRKS